MKKARFIALVLVAALLLIGAGYAYWSDTSVSYTHLDVYKRQDIILKARRRGFLTKFIILTSSLRREDFERAREIGVDGYILKDCLLYTSRCV